MDKIKKLFQSNDSKRGSYTLAMTSIMIAIVIIFNMIVNLIPENKRQFDISSTNIYEISSKSEKIIKKVDDDVTFYVLAEKDSTDKRIKTFINKYASLSSKLHVKWIDPILHPSVLTKYGTEENNIVISCKKTNRTTTVSFDDILVSSDSYYSTSSSASSFDGDGQLTSALNYVTSDKEYKAYYTSGHGESSLSSEVTSLLTKSRISTSDLLLMTATSIPDDCDLLIIDGATSDFTKDEVKLLSSYLKKGGKVVTLLAQTNKSMKNLYGLLKDYGLTVQSGYIADTERSYQGNYYYLIPNLSVSGDMASGISSNSVMMINSKGYAVTEKKQTQGTYVLGATSTESVKIKNNKGKKVTKESRLTVYGSNMLIDEQITSSFSSLENLTLFTNSVTACLNNADNVSISPKSLEVSYNTIAHPGPFSILVVFVIPVGLIIGGFIVWFRRRRR